MSSVKKLTITALLIALCRVLPMAFHAVGLGQTFSPMHLPVLLCGLLCGPVYGAVCGVAGPALASLLGGPPVQSLIWFIPELACYGLVAGLLYRRIRTGSTLTDMYLSLIPAMLAGRVIGGAAQAAYLLATAKTWTPAAWIAGYFVGTWPGAVAHLVLIPVIVFALTGAGLIPKRYGKSGR